MQPPKPILMTKTGLKQLSLEKSQIEKDRPAAVLDLKKAREMGDLSENGYYKSARAKLSSLDHRLRYLTHVIRYAKVQEASSQDKADIGATVTLEFAGGEVAYTIVGEHEANPMEKKISHISPLGRSLMQKSIGEIIMTTTPSGQKTYKIISITF